MCCYLIETLKTYFLEIMEEAIYKGMFIYDSICIKVRLGRGDSIMRQCYGLL